MSRISIVCALLIVFLSNSYAVAQAGPQLYNKNVTVLSIMPRDHKLYKSFQFAVLNSEEEFRALFRDMPVVVA